MNKSYLLPLSVRAQVLMSVIKIQIGTGELLDEIPDPLEESGEGDVGAIRSLACPASEHASQSKDTVIGALELGWDVDTFVHQGCELRRGQLRTWKRDVHFRSAAFNENRLASHQGLERCRSCA